MGVISIARAKFIICPPPLGSPRFARGTEKRARSVPPARRGNLKLVSYLDSNIIIYIVEQKPRYYPALQIHP